MLKNRCYKGGKKHKFRERYTEVPLLYKKIKTERMTPESMKNLLVYNKYVGDICVWCGKKILVEDEDGANKPRKDSEIKRSTGKTV